MPWYGTGSAIDRDTKRGLWHVITQTFDLPPTDKDFERMPVSRSWDLRLHYREQFGSIYSGFYWSSASQHIPGYDPDKWLAVYRSGF